MGKDVLLCSFSGGKTSAFMSAMLKEKYSDVYDIHYVFANTGQENDETLDFVRAVDEYFSLGVVWVEADVSPIGGVGTRHKVVNYETATKDIGLFASVCEKFGIPNFSSPHCTRELKKRPIESYMRSIGLLPKDYKTAIGIRTDEARRATGEGAIVYPLIDWVPSDKQDVDTFWEGMPFTLNLNGYEGNCKWCWKKSDNKLFRIATEKPYVFMSPTRLEMTYGKCGAKFKKDPGAPAEVFFRGRRSAQDIVMQAQQWAADGGMGKPVRDRGQTDGCSESCEIYQTELDV